MTPGHLEGLTIERIDTFAVRLPSLRSFSLAGGAVTLAGAPEIRVLVKVAGSDGSTGWGEATPIPSWTYETLESITTTIEGYLAPAVRGEAYALDAAIPEARRLAELDVAAFEQPLPANDIAGLRRLRKVSPVPVALDESLRHPSDLATFVKLDAIDVAIASTLPATPRRPISARARPRWMRLGAFCGESLCATRSARSCWL